MLTNIIGNYTTTTPVFFQKGHFFAFSGTFSEKRTSTVKRKEISPTIKAQ